MPSPFIANIGALAESVVPMQLPIHCFCVSYYLHFLLCFQILAGIFYEFYFWYVILLALDEDNTNGSFEFVWIACLQMGYL